MSGTSEAYTAAAIAYTGGPGILNLLDDAVAAVWSAEETTVAIKLASADMYRGYIGTEPDEYIRALLPPKLQMLEVRDE